MSVSLRQPPGVVHRERADRRHHLRAVDQREPLGRLELQRVQPGRGERLRAAEAPPGVDRLPLSDQHQRQVRERGEIAAGSDRALLRDDRHHPAVEQLDQLLRGSRADAGVPAREVLGPQQHHRSDDLVGEGVPTPAAWLIRMFACSRRVSLAEMATSLNAPNPVVTP